MAWATIKHSAPQKVRAQSGEDQIRPKLESGRRNQICGKRGEFAQRGNERQFSDRRSASVVTFTNLSAVRKIAHLIIHR